MADGYLKHLASVPLFRNCHKRDLEKISRLADEIDIEAGRELITEGDTGHEAFVIVEGTAKVTRGGEEIATLGPGDPFGELALIERAPRNATVTAATRLRVLVIGQREFAGLMDEARDFRESILRALVARLREKDLSIYG